VSIERLSLSWPQRPIDAIVHVTNAQAICHQAFLGLVPCPASLAFPWVLAARCVSVLALACGDATGVLGLAVLAPPLLLDAGALEPKETCLPAAVPTVALLGALAAGVLLVAPLEPAALAVAVAAGAAAGTAAACAGVAAAVAGVLGADAMVVVFDLATWPDVGALFAVLVAAAAGVVMVVAPVVGVALEAVVAAIPRPANVDRVNAVMMSLFMLSP
jgi:hypothetical protein